MFYESTLSNLLFNAMDAVFLRADPRRQLRNYSQFSYKIDRSWTGRPTTDAVGVFQDQHDNRHSVFLVSEAKRAADDRAKALDQLGRECSNFASTKQRCHFLALIVIVSEISISFYVYLLISQGAQGSITAASSSEPPPTVFIPILLVEDTATRDDLKLPKLLYALATSGLHFNEPHQVDIVPEEMILFRPSKSQDVVRVTSFPFGGYWVKVFPSTSTRRVEMNLMMIPDAILVVDTPALKVMRYPHIPGQVGLSEMTPALFILAAQRLLDFHTTHQCAHGDIRLSNLIVNAEDYTVSWIDFDFASPFSQPRRYPPSWTIDLIDAVRHENSKPGSPILQEHDLFSFRSLLGLYRPRDEAVRQDWILPSDTDLHAVIYWLRTFDPYLVLELQIAKIGKQGTGSPKQAK